MERSPNFAFHRQPARPRNCPLAVCVAEQVSHWLSMTSRIQRPSFMPFSLDCNACPERPSWVVRRSDPCCATDVRAAAAPALLLDLRYKRASARTCVPLPEVSDPPALAESWRTSPAEFREKLFA